MHWYIDAFKKYAVFSGRASRAEYWMFMLINSLVILALSYIAGFISNKLVGIVYALCVLASVLPALAVAVRRLHDVGKSGWWWFIQLIPLVGGVWLFVLFVLDSKHGDNKYGPNPKGVGAAPGAPMNA